MNTFFVMVRAEDKPGAFVYKAFINADNVFNAYATAKAMYGRLLLSAFATPVL